MMSHCRKTDSSFWTSSCLQGQSGGPAELECRQRMSSWSWRRGSSTKADPREKRNLQEKAPTMMMRFLVRSLGWGVGSVVLRDEVSLSRRKSGECSVCSTPGSLSVSESIQLLWARAIGVMC